MKTCVSTGYIAADLQVRRAYVADNIVKRPDFPKPAFQLSQKNRGWFLTEYKAWKRKHFRKT